MYISNLRSKDSANKFSVYRYIIPHRRENCKSFREIYYYFFYLLVGAYKFTVDFNHNLSICI